MIDCEPSEGKINNPRQKCPDDNFHPGEPFGLRLGPVLKDLRRFPPQQRRKSGQSLKRKRRTIAFSCSTATAPEYPGAGETSCNVQFSALVAPGSTVSRVGILFGPKDTVNLSSGSERPMPRALIKASLRVQHSKNAAIRWEGSIALKTFPSNGGIFRMLDPQ